MLKMDIDTMRAIEKVAEQHYKVTVYWQEAETYTEDDYLLSVGDLETSMSGESYEVANVTVSLRNKDYYFSRRLAWELPNNKLVEIYISIVTDAGIRDILIFRGIVSTWQLTETTLTMNINA